MKNKITITIGAKWADAPGNGSACCCCGDACWLAMRQLILVVDGKDHPQDFGLCKACADGAGI